MARRLLLGGLALVVLVILAAGITAVINKHQKTICQKLIAYIQQRDSTSSYKLFSADLQGQITSQSWAAQVPRLQQAYGQGSLSLTQVHIPDPTGSVEYDYQLVNGGHKFKLACFASSTKQGEQIDAFSSSSQ